MMSIAPPSNAPSNAVRATSPSGDVVLWEPAPGVLVHLVSGLVSIPIAEGIVDFYRPVVARRTGVRSFADFRGATGYHREARELLVDFTLEYLSSFAAINILLGSKILSMGIGIYRLTVGDVVRTYANEREFMRVFDAASHGVDEARRT
jgi:hypothetical protein